MSSSSLKDLTRRVLVACVFLGVLFASFAARADAKSGSSTVVVFIAYTIGSVCAFVYKTGIGSTKHLVTRTFRWRALIIPTIWAAILSIPMVLLLTPLLGPSSGGFSKDALNAYLMTYAIIDMSTDFFTLSVLFRKKFEEAADRDSRKSPPPEEPPAASS